MQWFQANEELSQQLAQHFKELQPYNCYDNICFNLNAIKEWSKKRKHPVEICFGYLQIQPKQIAIRHCFLKEGNTIIDPTLTLCPDGFRTHLYSLMGTFSLDDYLKCLTFEFNPILSQYLSAEERMVKRQLLEAGIRPLD